MGAPTEPSIEQRLTSAERRLDHLTTAVGDLSGQNRDTAMHVQQVGNELTKTSVTLSGFRYEVRSEIAALHDHVDQVAASTTARFDQVDARVDQLAQDTRDRFDRVEQQMRDGFAAADKRMADGFAALTALITGSGTGGQGS